MVLVAQAIFIYKMLLWYTVQKQRLISKKAGLFLASAFLCGTELQNASSKQSTNHTFVIVYVFLFVNFEQCYVYSKGTTTTQNTGNKDEHCTALQYLLHYFPSCLKHSTISAVQHMVLLVSFNMTAYEHQSPPPPEYWHLRMLGYTTTGTVVVKWRGKQCALVGLPHFTSTLRYGMLTICETRAKPSLKHPIEWIHWVNPNNLLLKYSENLS